MHSMFQFKIEMNWISGFKRGNCKIVKIVINDNIIEQVTDFKYLGYRISDYKSDLEDKLQTYNKIKNSQHYS
jgi:hypothetical protein